MVAANETVAVKDVGLGTAYERWAIYDLVARWGAAAASALEGPIDGMAGMPGLHLLPLARRGCRVTVAHPDAGALSRVEAVYARAGLSDRLATTQRERVPEGPFDLVLGFNFHDRLPAGAWRSHISALAQAAARDLVIFATHPRSYGTYLRRVVRTFERARTPELFDHEACEPEVMRKALGEHGTIVEERFVDCPWWPDLFVSAGETLTSASRARLGANGGAVSTPYDWGPDRFPFATTSRPAELRRALRRHPTFDAAAPTVAGFFAHHRAFRVSRDGFAGHSSIP